MIGHRLGFQVLAMMGATAALSACGGSTNVTPTPPPGSVGILCNQSNPTAPQARLAANFEMRTARRGRARISALESGYIPGAITVTYDRALYQAKRAVLTRSAARYGGQVVKELDFAHIGKVVQILHVRPGTEASAMASLRTSPGVLSVGRSAYRHLDSATPVYTNDPYAVGFSPDNVPPLYEGASTPGQWDLHVVCAPDAWGYSSASNSTGTAQPAAAGGSAGIKIAIVDTGADLTHPELQPASSRIAFAEQVVNGQVTTGIASMHDDDGHGTDVAGIAAATGNNGLGFAGVAYNASLMIFKVFQDPSQCGSGGCTASTSDIATAINDAVTNGANVINLSLGGSSAAGDEESAVANAIAANVVVVAAAGNGDSNTGIAQPTLDYPAADPGVIAVGASAIDDTNASSPNLKVASYSNYEPNSNSWGVVAPGGDACPNTPSSTNCADTDDLHWIENIYSSTASQPGSCTPDFQSQNSTVDCRILIIGTSQATPHVSGAVALLLSAGAQQSPSAMQSLICNSATVIQQSDTNASHQGCGELNVYHAMAETLGDTSYP